MAIETMRVDIAVRLDSKLVRTRADNSTDGLAVAFDYLRIFNSALTLPGS